MPSRGYRTSLTRITTFDSTPGSRLTHTETFHHGTYAIHTNRQRDKPPHLFTRRQQRQSKSIRPVAHEFRPNRPDRPIPNLGNNLKPPFTFHRVKKNMTQTTSHIDSLNPRLLVTTSRVHRHPPEFPTRTIVLATHHNRTKLLRQLSRDQRDAQTILDQISHRTNGTKAQIQELSNIFT